MNSGKVCTFWQLYKENKIVIPKIQRDYVQGRNNPQVKKNSENLAKTLVKALCRSEEIMLNFVYGYKQGNAFIPIDGQQRLTTLFLLHFYVFKKASKLDEMKIKVQNEANLDNKNLNFSYETRYTTNRFFRDLYDNFDFTQFENDDLAAYIQNASWQSSIFATDPSIFSSIAMLDKIHKAFLSEEEMNKIDWLNLYEKLIDLDCPISFMLLDIKDEIGKPNELYIRMNSRGKQLTSFENFKADLYSYLDRIGENDFKKVLAEKIDGKWLDYIWNLHSNDQIEIAKKHLDTFYREIFHWLLLSRLIINCPKFDAKSLKYDDDIKEMTKWINQDMDSKIDEIYLDDYLRFIEKYVDLKTDMDDMQNEVKPNLQKVMKENEINKIFISALNDIKNVLDILSDENIISDKFCKAIFEKIFFFSEEKRKYISTLKYYPQRAFLFALSVYNLKEEFNINNFKMYLRLINNLINNSEIDAPYKFQGVCCIIESISEISGNIIENIDELAKKLTTPFKDEIITEEIFKLRLIKANITWKDLLIQAEQIEYFDGEILFLLNMSGVENEKDALNQTCINKFKENLTLIEKMFNNKQLTERMREKSLLQRAMLTYKDYKSVVGDSENGIYSYYVFNERHHNNDIRGLIRPGKNKEGCNAFNILVNDLLNNLGQGDIEKKIEKIIENFTVKPDCSEEDLLRFYLVKYPQMFEFIKNYCYIYFSKGENESGVQSCYLMKNSRRDSLLEYKTFVLAVETLGKEKTLEEILAKIEQNNDVTVFKYGQKKITYFKKDSTLPEKFIINNNKVYENCTIEDFASKLRNKEI